MIAISPRGTTLAKAKGTPPIMAVPQSGPMTSSPRSAASSFRALSSAMRTLSLKIIACRPRRMALRASAAAKSPGTEISARLAPGNADTAVRSVRGRQLSPSPSAPLGVASRSEALASAAIAAAASRARMARIKSPPRAASPSVASRSASAMISLLAGVPIIKAASSTPSSAATAREIRIKATESRKKPRRTWLTIALMRRPVFQPMHERHARNRPSVPGRHRRRPGRDRVPCGRSLC